MSIPDTFVIEVGAAAEAAHEPSSLPAQVANAIPALISYIGKDGRYRFVNAAYSDWFGQTAEEIRGRHMREVLGEAAAEAVRPRFQAALAGERQHFETTLPYSAGPRRVDVRYVPASRDGAVDGVIVLAVDRSEAETYDRRFAEALDGFGDAFASVDFQWNVLILNKGAEAHFGVSRAEAIGRNLFEIAPAGSNSKLSQAVHRAMAERISVETEVESEIKPGHWVALRAFPLETGLAMSFRDVTEKRVRLQREREQAARLNLALSASGLGEWSWDAVTDLVDFSPRAAEIWGLPTGEVYTWTRMQEILHPEDRQRAADATDRAMAERTDYEIEYRIVRPSDGEERWIMVRAHGQYAPDGAPVGMTGVLGDITRLKQDESRQRLLINELNHRVKNTLATVQSLAHQTLRDGVSPREARGRLTDRLLALSAAHNVLTRGHWEGAELADIVAEAVRPYDGPEQRIRLEGPRARLTPNLALAVSMALHELATNAVKYGALSSPTGRVELTWVRADGQVQLTWREQGGPAVTPPERIGFGSRLLTQGLAAEFGAPAELDYRPEGLVATLRAPAA